MNFENYFGNKKVIRQCAKGLETRIAGSDQRVPEGWADMCIFANMRIKFKKMRRKSFIFSNVTCAYAKPQNKSDLFFLKKRPLGVCLAILRYTLARRLH
jgi:uncharacterized Rossmann fold enzyme